MADRGTVGARLDHVGLTVTDLNAAVSWFCDVFGLVPELTLRVEALDLSIEMLVHPAFGYRLELLHRPGSAAARKPANPGEAALREGAPAPARSRRPGRGGRGSRQAVRPGTGPGDL